MMIVVNNQTANAGDMRDEGSIPGSGWSPGGGHGNPLQYSCLENLEHYFASMWDECNREVVWTYFGIAFLWDWNENWSFPVLWPLLSFLLQQCPTLCDSVDCSPPSSSVHGILQARILEWVAMTSSRGSSWPRDQTCASYISCLGRQVLYTTWEELAPPGKPHDDLHVMNPFFCLVLFKDAIW